MGNVITLSLGLLALVSAETTMPTLYSEPDEPTICYGDDECRGKDVCDMGTYTCRPETDTPTIWTTPSPSAPNGCCYGASYKANDKCAMAMEAGKCAEKGCEWLITEDPKECEITTTETPTTTVEEGCCKGTSYMSNAECNLGLDEKSCGRKCEWITGGVLEEDCKVTTTTPTTTSTEVGCCKGSDPKTDTMCNPKTDSNSCARSNSCEWIEDGDLENLDCQSDCDGCDAPGCCYGDTAKTHPMCIAKETVGDCERSGKCEWREDASEDEPADCDLPTTTNPPTTTVEAGCCYGDSYKANSKCLMALTEGKCADKGCEWLITEDPKDCEITTTKTITTTEVGCCKGDSVKSNPLCNKREDRDSCDRSSSCHFIVDGVVDVDCVVDTTTVEAGCCYGNPNQAYSKRWMDTCTQYFTERECTFNMDDAGNARCVFEPMNEYMDCSMLWPTTTTTTEPTTTETANGCCHGDSYKANDKCVGLEDQVGCERKSCTWLLTEHPEDCVITTTTSTPVVVVPGCCKADSVKREDMCLARDTQEKCESSSSCVEWISDIEGVPADCSFTETTTETPGCCYINPAQVYSHKYQETCITFGTERDCLKLTDTEGATRCIFEEMNEYMDCAMLWPTTTTSTPIPAGCCHGTSYKQNGKCAMAMEAGKCEDKGCTWLITDEPEDCEMTTTSTPETTPSPIEPGCCKGTSKSSNDKCNGIVDNEEKCDARSSCFWIAFGDVEVDCAWKETSPPEEPGCCYGNPDAAYSSRWMTMCKTFGFESECTMLTHDDGTPRCVFELMGEYGDCETVWPTTTTTTAPTTTETAKGCCHGDSYKANDKCAMLEDKVGCERKSCTWLLTEDPKDCEITTTLSVADPGCCKGTSMSSNDKCNAMVDDADMCNARSSCEWIAFGVLEEDCIFEVDDPGCCYGNPAAAYSSRWMTMCKTFGTETECTLLLHDDGTPRCVFEPMGDYEDCESVWPTTTTTSSPTDAPAGCCYGGSYKANTKCMMAMEQEKCESKDCEWKVTEDPADCVITTTSSPTTTIEAGCCKGEDTKSNDMCNQKTDSNSCERSNTCTWIKDGTNAEECNIDEEKETGCCFGDTVKTHEMCLENEDDKVGCERSGKCEWRKDISPTEDAVCDLPTTTSTPWLGAQDEVVEADYTLPYNPYKQSQQQSRKKNNHRQEEAMMFGGAGSDTVVGQAMQYQVSLSSVVLMLVAAFALYQTYAWMSARKNKDYAAVQTRPAQYYQSA